MLKFADIVSDVLLEQPAPNQQQNVNVDQLLLYLKQSSNDYKTLVQTYINKYGSTESDIETNLKRYLQTVTAQKNYFAGKTLDNLGGYSLIPFYDAFMLIFANLGEKEANFTGLVQYITDPQNLNAVNAVFKGISDKIEQSVSVQEYNPTDNLLIKAKNVLDNQTNKLSQTAIQSLGSDTVHSAITKIIAKRIPILDRVMGLKGLVKPFNQSVITPILQQFKKYTGYKQGDALKNPTGWLKDRLWPKKVPGDFSKMVEDISANNLLNVAVLAYEYYIYLLSTQGKPLNTQEQNLRFQPNETQPVNASLDIFSTYIDYILSEEFDPAQLLRNIAQNRKAIKSSKYSEAPLQQKQKQKQVTGLPPEQVEKISNQIGNAPDPDYTDFIGKGESRYLPGLKYDLNTISKDPSREAKALYKALTEMAYFVRPRTSAAQRIGAVAGALGSLRVGMGPVG